MMAESEQTLVEQFVALKTANSKQQTGQTSAAAVVRARFAGGLWLGVNTAAANESFWRAPTSSSDLSSLGAAVQFARSLARSLVNSERASATDFEFARNGSGRQQVARVAIVRSMCGPSNWKPQS